MSFESLNMASSLLRSSRIGMDTAGRNLAGSGEAGYTRQSMSTTALQPSTGWNGQTVTSGLGVQVNGVSRARQGLADQVYRMRAEDAGGPQALDSLLDDLEGRLSANDGLQQAGLDFEQAWTTLQNQPDDTALRSQALQEGKQLADTFRQQSQLVADVRGQARTQMSSNVERANQILGNLADLNKRIVSSPGNTMGRNTLLDQRDAMLDELSGMMDFRVAEQPSGAINLYQSGNELLNLEKAETLSLDSNGNVNTSQGRSLSLGSGSLSALETFSTTTLDGFQAQLDGLATTLRDRFNEIHALGYGSDGLTGRNFFSGTGAADLAVALGGPDELATGVARSESSASIALTTSTPLNGQGAFAASGTIDINGVSIAWNDGQSLDSILTSFGAAGVKASYDGSSHKVVLARDPSVAGPSTISISDTSGNLAAMLGLPASSTPGGAGDNAGAVALVQRLTRPVFGQSANRTLTDGGRDLIVEAGRQRSLQMSQMEATQSALGAATERRNQASGVSTDEELLSLERYQQAFEAAARVASVADETITTLIRMGGN